MPSTSIAPALFSVSSVNTLEPRSNSFNSNSSISQGTSNGKFKN